MRNLIFLIFEAQRNFRNELYDSFEVQHNCAITERHFCKLVKAQPNFCYRNFTTQCKYRIFFEFRRKKSKSFAKQGRHLSTLRSKWSKIKFNV